MFRVQYYRLTSSRVLVLTLFRNKIHFNITMKFTWILVLISTMTMIKCKPADIDDHLSESNTALDLETNKTIHLMKRSKDAVNKRKKFLITFKPHIKYHRRHRRVKKREPMRKTQKNAITKNITKSNNNYKNSRNIFEEYIDKTHGNQRITNSDEIKTKELREKNTRSESKSIVAKARRESVKCLRKCCKFKNIFKNHNCLSNFKRFGRQYLSNRSIRFIKVAGNICINGNLEENDKKSLSDRVVDSTQSLDRSITTSIDSLIQNKLSLGEEEIYKTNARLINDENINNSSRLKRSANIIEEERMATTSSGFRFTGRDTSIHSNFIYKNIHN
ncbi:uncharacterized protein LOC125072430 [Vanessa atalanta]|uniref:uncharacterized protein LOC125072430 n=1 Tax=Vanessa atalanta TaxID=42275 RepID=UPI001FCDB548|nr:uncharacterized protein LOC125072430 [Vanessa atalanta]